MNRRNAGGRLIALVGAIALAVAIAAPVARAEVVLDPAAIPAGCTLVGDVQAGSQAVSTTVTIPQGSNFALLRYETEFDYGAGTEVSFTATAGASATVRQDIPSVAGSRPYRLAGGAGEYRVDVAGYRPGDNTTPGQSITADIFACDRAQDVDPTPAAEPLPSEVLATNVGSGNRQIPLDFTDAAYVRIAYDARSTENFPITLLLRNPELQSAPLKVFQPLRADGYVDFPVNIVERPDGSGGGPGVGSRIDGYTLEVQSGTLVSSQIEVSKLDQTGEFDGDLGNFDPPSALGCARSISGAGGIEGSTGQSFTLSSAEAAKDTIIVMRNFLGPSPTTVLVSDAGGDVVYEEDFGVGLDQERRLDLDPGRYTIRNANGIGHASLAATYIACDAAANEPPVAVDDRAETNAGQSVRIDVLRNDSDPENDPLTVDIGRSPGDGTARVNADGSVTYTPDDGFTGTDTFTYVLSDGQGNSDVATVTVEVAPVPPVNRPPDARPDSATTREDTPVRIDVLRNDTDPDGDDLTISGIFDPRGGGVRINPDGTVTFTPESGFTGLAGFGYEVEDGNGGTDSAPVSVRVIPDPEPPVDPDPDPDPPPAPVRQCLSQPEIRNLIGQKRVNAILAGREGIQESRKGDSKGRVYFFRSGVQSDFDAGSGNDVVVTLGGRAQGSTDGGSGRDGLCSFGSQNTLIGGLGKDVAITKGVQNTVDLQDGRGGDVARSLTPSFPAGGNEALVDSGDKTKNLERE